MLNVVVAMCEEAVRTSLLLTDKHQEQNISSFRQHRAVTNEAISLAKYTVGDHIIITTCYLIIDYYQNYQKPLLISST